MKQMDSVCPVSSLRFPVVKSLIAAFVCCILTGLPHMGVAKTVPMTYIFNGPESSLDVRYEYQWEILRNALEKTRESHGPYIMKGSLPMAEARQTYELMNATGRLTVMYLDVKPGFEQRLYAVHIPVDRNLVGYRVFLIRKERSAEFAAVKTIDDLRKFSFGLHADWIDVGIMQSNGFKVVTGSSYDGLFEMLDHRRFDIFSRAVCEVRDEFEFRHGSMPDLYIEETICLYYPLPMYFWFSRTDEGKRLAARVEAGMRQMLADGTYDRIFDLYQRTKIETLKLKNRKLFNLDNPFLGPGTPFSDKRLWFDPKTYKPVGGS